ncbi:MAG TPA: DUF3515 domain-containing protein [Motilibacterales bacterium]|nr:DUF3515 domain-containing protein [Motilibacterales bacterium]
MAGLVLGSSLIAACARPVEVSAPSPAADVTAACAQFTAALPAGLSTVGERRDVTPDSVLTAAYGDPPVGVRCGVPDPASLSPTSTLVAVEGIDWLAEELTGGWRLTSIGRTANVEITVPTDQGPAPSVAADLAPTIAATLPAAG